ARFWNAGHILGSASIEVEIETGDEKQRFMRLLFSGDIGPDHKLFHPDPDAPSNLDYVICEATYGARKRPVLKPDARRAVLAGVVREAMGRGGVLVIPAFSVERTQELLADLSLLMKKGEIEERIVFLDSPLAIKATEVFESHAEDLEDLGLNGELFQNTAFHFTRTVEESKAINHYENGVIIIAASGMCEAGRILHHLRYRIHDNRTLLLLVGYMAEHTLGRRLEDLADHHNGEGRGLVKILGKEYPVKARIEKIDGFSAHGDRNDLLRYLKEGGLRPKRIALVHGEEAQSQAFADTLRGLGHTVVVPRRGESLNLD
ncbi:MAG: MBL fold metallo-hydrolase, partial [Candidatus Cloacimonetes bacterium]|nr:MBL fold metallo-hydrolase [Candidatus Cloacimonadota bacterium]